MSLIRKIPPRHRGIVEQLGESAEEAHLRIVRALGTQVVAPSNGFRFQQKSKEGIFVSSGEYRGFGASGTHQTVTCSPGSLFSRQIVVTGSLILNNAILDCHRNTPAIVVKSTGRLLLSGCHISKDANIQTAATDRYVSVETGGYASINNCIFYGDQSATGSIVYNDDAVNIGRVAVTGCVNLTDILVPAQAFTNVGYVQVVP